jgi:hypothetical protein
VRVGASLRQPEAWRRALPFAVGVFLVFTMSQAGMVVHWLRDAHWRRSLAFNAIGGFLSAIVFVTAGVTKFIFQARFGA